MIRRELGKVVVAENLSCRKMASILGSIRSCLVALPCLRAFTDQFVKFVNFQKSHGWDYLINIPRDLKDQLRELKSVLQNWQGRPFEKASTKILHSGSSDFVWAGVNTQSGEAVQEFWRQKSSLHIHMKELLAATETLKSLVKPGEKICLWM